MKTNQYDLNSQIPLHKKWNPLNNIPEILKRTPENPYDLTNRKKKSCKCQKKY